MDKYQYNDNGCLRECQGSLIAVLPGQEWKGEAQRYLKESKVYIKFYVYARLKNLTFFCHSAFLSLSKLCVIRSRF